ITLANDPNNVLTFARTTGATDFTRQMAEVAFASVARQDAENASILGALTLYLDFINLFLMLLRIFGNRR
ncbi:hypothetical protein ONK29_26260, partial [Salmonella enterica subsp. enterica serovar Anatum]|nr:hypothetical protein [Salmonella enterica subsp. enterica serovar Anatum]